MYKIDEAFKPLYTSNKRYFFITGGRGSLKSTSVHDFISRLTYDKGHGILVTRYTMTSAEKSIIPEFKIVATRNGSINDFIITSSKITNKLTGSFILFSGIKTSSGDQTANLKSLAGITTWVIDEGEDFVDEKTFDDIDDSIRTNEKQNRVIWIQNPSTVEHFIYERWVAKTPKYLNIEGFDIVTSSHKDVEAIHTTYHIAKSYLSQSILDKITETKTNNPKKYLHKYLGAWLDKAEGVIYSNWKIGEFVQTDLSCYGQDFGFSIDPTTLIQVSIDNKHKRIYAKELLFKAGLTTSDIFTLNSKLVALNGLIVADSAEPRLISELKSKGLNIKGIEKPKITDRIALVQDYELIIDENSTNLIKELNNYSWHDKKSETPIDNFNHLLDALGYAVWDMLVKKKGVYGIF
jgi:phage terminase large subunit